LITPVEERRRTGRENPGERRGRKKKCASCGIHGLCHKVCYWTVTSGGGRRKVEKEDQRGEKEENRGEKTRNLRAIYGISPWRSRNNG